MHRLPRLPRFLALATLLFTAAFSLLRLGFWLYFDNPADPLPGGELLTALYLGLKFDLRLALLLLLPLFLLAWLPWLNPLRGALARRLWVGYLALAGMAVLLVYMIDFGHYAYLQTRLDVGALRFLKNLGISAQMVWESYPVVPLALALAAGTALLAWALARLALYCTAASAPRFGWKGRTVTVLITATLLLGGLFGRLASYPLRWSDAFFGNHAFAAQVTFNPILYFADSVRNGGGVTYDTAKVRAHYPEIAAWLGVDTPNAETLDFRRRHVPAAAPARPPNVVIVILESFASYKSGLSGNPLNPTPHIDALANNGYYFENFYTPQTGTARSVFCAITGIPDVETHGTSTRNPRIVDQHALLNSFDGYEKFYFLGGSASWGNIRGLLTNNIAGLNIYEEGSYSAPNVDVWGVSDLDLFREADQVLRVQQKPFVAVIQTSGNHRPYTIPDDNAGFRLQHHPHDELHRYGFQSEEEYNSYRFMDHSVGQFMELAAQAGYRDNTLFAFFGDHGITGFAGEHAGKAETQLDLGSNRVPFIIYGPGLLPEPRRFSRTAGEADVMATLAALAGRSYVNTTLGRNLLDDALPGEHYAFKIMQVTPPRIGLIGAEYYFQMSTDGSQKELHRIHGDNPRDNLITQLPELAAQLESMTRGYHETAKYMLYHNKPVANDEAPKPQ